MKLSLADLIALSNALADKMDHMVQNADELELHDASSDPNFDASNPLVYRHLKDLFKKVNDEYAERVKGL